MKESAGTAIPPSKTLNQTTGTVVLLQRTYMFVDGSVGQGDRNVMFVGSLFVLEEDIKTGLNTV